MRLKAKVSFVGAAVSAGAGQEFSCPDEIAEDLLNAGYAEKVKEDESKLVNTKRNSRSVKSGLGVSE